MRDLALYESNEYEEEQEQVPLPAPDANIPGRVVNVVPANACKILRNPNGTFKQRRPADITHVVIHVIESSGAFANSIESWRVGGGQACFKPHYGVSKTGEITQIVPERTVSIHGNGRNGDSIGIEHQGWSRDPDDFTDARYLASAALVRDICARRNIPIDRAHIDGHDNAPGTSHGDPGGYWDWDYYLALVRWNGDPRTRPVRIVVDTASPGFAAGTGWSSRLGRKADVEVGKLRNGGPFPKHSWSKRFFFANPSAMAGAAQASRFTATIPVPGTYEVSVWHPSLPGHNPATPVKVDKRGYLWGTLGTRPVDQQRWQSRFRATIALPHTPVWTRLGQLDCVRGNQIVVEVGRNSNQRGLVVADAVRIFRIS
jgi:hypothetical protein